MMDDLKDSDFFHFPNIQDHLKSYPTTNLPADKYEVNLVLFSNNLKNGSLSWKN